MLKYLFPLIALLAVLTGCGGGGDSSVTTISGGGLNASGASPAVWLSSAYSRSPANVYIPKANSLEVVVDSGPNTFSLSNVNMLFATVQVCVPGDPSKCQSIDHVLVDTGSVGLRILASKVSQLGLAPDPNKGPILECYPFVIGGLWGPTVMANVGLGQQLTTPIPIQLIQDNPSPSEIQAPADCINAANGQVLSSVATLGANGVLGIGSTTLDCSQACIDGNYSQTLIGYIPYWSCPTNATSTTACKPTPVDLLHQVFNPVAALPKDASNSGKADSNGVVLSLPAVPGLGAAQVHGELIFGIGTRANNNLDTNTKQVRLGVDSKTDSYLTVTTTYNGSVYFNSYLDTGTNGLFFVNKNNPIPTCSGSVWYCPVSLLPQNAVISDGDALPPNNSVNVGFNVGNANSLFSTTNSAFGDLAGAPPSTSTTGVLSFSWGLPFFYGRRVVLSIWDMNPVTLTNPGPWYSWSSI